MIHVVNNLRAEFTCPDEDVGFKVRHSFAQALLPEMIDAVDKICSKYVGEEEVLKIDSLEIDLLHFNLHSFGSDFMKVFEAKFESALAARTEFVTPATRMDLAASSNADGLIWFLENGMLPWWLNEEQVDINELCKTAINLHQGALKQFLYNNRTNPVVWQRAAWQLNAEARAGILNLFDELVGAKKTLQALLTTALSQGADGISKDSTIPDTAKDVLDKTIVKAGDAGSITDEMLVTLVITTAPLIFSNAGDNVLLENILVAKIQQAANLNYRALANLYSQYVSTEADGNVNKTGAAEERPGFMAGKKASVTGVKKFAVRNSGIVLLSPFLKIFFTSLNLLDANKWKDMECCYRGIHLLKFLACGNSKQAEYTMGLEKLICGLSTEMPVPLDITLTNEEIAESENLLKSVIEHWKALKNTSINGLREAFLRRDGIISKNGNDWTLKVERKTPDVLVDSIPWGFSTIKMPWNNYMLFVEW